MRRWSAITRGRSGGRSIRTACRRHSGRCCAPGPPGRLPSAGSGETDSVPVSMRPASSRSLIRPSMWSVCRTVLRSRLPLMRRMASFSREMRSRSASFSCRSASELLKGHPCQTGREPRLGRATRQLDRGVGSEPYQHPNHSTSQRCISLGWRTPCLLYEVIYVTPRQLRATFVERGQSKGRRQPGEPSTSHPVVRLTPGSSRRGENGRASLAQPPPGTSPAVVLAPQWTGQNREAIDRSG